MMMTGSCGWRSFSLLQQLEARLARHADVATPAPAASPSSSAASASCARTRSCATAMPSRASAFSSTQRIDRSSSTIQTGFMLRCGGLRAIGHGVRRWHSYRGQGLVGGASAQQRKQDRETVRPGPALAFDHAAVLLRRTSARASGRGRCRLRAPTPADRRCVADRVRNAGSVVDDMQFQCQPMALAAQSSPGARCGCAADPARWRPSQRLRGVAHDVEQRLDQLLAVGREFGGRLAS